MIEQEMEYYGISREQLAQILRISLRTLQRRLAEPWTWSAGEINQLKGVFGWTKEECAEFVERCTL